MAVTFRRICWVLSVLFLSAALFLEFLFGEKLQGQNFLDHARVFITLLLATFGTTSVLTLIVALIPWKEQRYGMRFWSRLPYTAAFVTASALLLVYSVFFLYPETSGMRQLSGVNFETIETAPAADCMSIHDGVFENEGFRIERRGAYQLNYEKTLGSKDELEVDWPTPCEYQLRQSGSDEVMRVKILQADSSGYDCAFMATDADRLVFTMRLNRVR